MKKPGIIKNLSPLNDFDKMATSIYIVKKLLAFFTIYCLAAVVGEEIIIGILTELKYAIIGTVNLYLISTIFSLLVLYRSNIWVSCGLHSIWNFILYGILGLTLSGNEIVSNGVLGFEICSSNTLSGGLYGIEASIITTIILSTTVAAVVKCWQRKSNTHGI